MKNLVISLAIVFFCGTQAFLQEKDVNNDIDYTNILCNLHQEYRILDRKISKLIQAGEKEELEKVKEEREPIGTKIHIYLIKYEEEYGYRFAWKCKRSQLR